MLLRQLFDHDTFTYTYLLADEASRQAVLIDPVIERLERDLQLIEELELELVYVLDTHVHADHITGSGHLRERTGAKIVGSAEGAPCADIQVVHGERIELGDTTIEVLATPGHTNDSLSYRAGDNVFTGDALLIRKTGRTDFQNGDPKQLYASITTVLFALPDETKVWPGHDYEGLTVSSIGEEKRHNIRIANKSEAQFVELMNNLGLPDPKHIKVAVPANQQCGCEAVTPS